MNGARAALVDALALEGVRVVDYAREIDPPTEPTVMVRLDRVAPSRYSSGHLDYGFALLLFPGLTEAGPADDELEQLLADVIGKVETSPPAITWTEATRSVWGDQLAPMFELVVTLASKKETTP